MHDVFISYKSEEYDEALWIRDTLEAQGITCWMAPASIPGGSDYAREIPVAIKACKVFVLLLSARSQASRWVKRELDTALNEEKTVLPFVLERFELSEDFGFYLGVVQRYDASNSRLEAMDKMLRELKVILEIKEELAQMEQLQTRTVSPEAKAKETDPLAVARAQMQLSNAEQGDPEEQFQMGRLYEQGAGVPYSLNDAMEWYRRAAEQLHAQAAYRMGMCYLAGERKSKAIRWLEKAADLQYTDAAYQLGMCYLDGIGVNENDEQAIQYLSRAGNRGHLRAAFRLAQLYENRLAGMEDNDPKREQCFQLVDHWLLRAACEDDPEALYRLGKLYEHSDQDQAMNYYRQAAEQAHSLAQYAMARLYTSQKKTAKALVWLEKAAQKGLPDAQFDLALHYRSEKRETMERYWMDQAAEGGHGPAQYEAACYYLRQEDTEKAIGLLRRAAGKRLPDAVCALALCYYAGNGVEQSCETAIGLLRSNINGSCRCHGPSAVYLAQMDSGSWKPLRTAAAQGHVPAMMLLADILVKKSNPTEAMFWYDRAAQCFRYANRYDESKPALSMFLKLKKKYGLRWLFATKLRKENKLFPYWRCTFHDPMFDRWLKIHQKTDV